MMATQGKSVLTLAASIAMVGWAAVAASCAAAQMHQPAVVVAPVPVAEVLLPPASPVMASASASVLRVTVTPTVSGATWPALLQPRLRVAGEPGGGVNLPPWTLYPPEEPATFTVRVPTVIRQAVGRGQAIHLTLTATPLDAMAAQGLAAPTFSVAAVWGSP